MVKVPSYDEMMNPLLIALKELGGSGTIEEIASKAANVMQLTEDQLNVLHNPEKGGLSEFEYRLAWTRTYLKKFGLLENSSRGVWALTVDGKNTNQVKEKEVVKFVKEQQRLAKKDRAETDDELDPDISHTWQQELLEVLLEMEPSAFERLAQRLLRESGFTQVEVTGRGGDGGIDGKGIMRLGGLLSFHVFFQCKRYQGSVGSGDVRDFRGAMTGRADKGMIITTSSFTKDASIEATRDGAPPIDIIDGDQLVQLLKQLSLGVSTKVVSEEEIKINKDWFEGI